MGKSFKKKELFSLHSTNEKVEKFINYIMLHGKKNTARRIFNDTLDEIKANGHMNPFVVWETAIDNASPHMMVKSKRIGGAIYQVPLEVPNRKRFFYSCKWLLDAVHSKKGKPTYKKLAEELLAAYSGQGSAVKKKEDTHRMADANRAFAYLAKYVK